MFSDYQPPEALQSALSQAAIAAADLDPASRSVSVVVECPCYISDKLIEQAQRDIAALYGLRSLTVTAVHPADQLHNADPDDLMQMFVQLNSMARGSLAGAQWTWEGSTLHIRLRGNGKQVIEDCIPQVRMSLSRRFSTQVDIRVEAGQALEGKELFDAMEKMRVGSMGQIAAMPAAQKKQQAASEDGAIFGRAFSGNAVPMKDLRPEMGGVIVTGSLFVMAGIIISGV